MEKELKTPLNNIVHGESTTFDRILAVDVPGIAAKGEKFKLENGFYINEKETILRKSTDKTGKFFKKIQNDDTSN